MRGSTFKFLAIGLLILACGGFWGCKARQASPHIEPASTSNAAAQDDASEDDFSAEKVDVEPRSGRLTDNKLVFGEGAGGTAARYVYGALTEGLDEVSGNTLFITGGLITDSAYGGYTEGWAKNNMVNVTGGKIAKRVEGGHGRQGSTGNQTYFENGETENVYGGYSADGPANNNRLVVRGGTIRDDAQAGLSLGSSAAGNTLVIEGGVIEDQAYGGYGMEGPATGNTTIVSGGVVEGDAQGAVSSTHEATGNTLILRGSPQIGGSVYGAFAVGEHGNDPDDVTGNKILLEGFSGALGDLWNAEHLSIDAGSRLSSRANGLNFYNCLNVKNNGVIIASGKVDVYFESANYSGKGGFELTPGAYITMGAGKLNAPLRIKISSDGTLQPFSHVQLVELRKAVLGRGLTAANAVQLLNPKVGGLTLRLEHEESNGGHFWYLSGK